MSEDQTVFITFYYERIIGFLDLKILFYFELYYFPIEGFFGALCISILNVVLHVGIYLIEYPGIRIIGSVHKWHP